MVKNNSYQILAESPPEDSLKNESKILENSVVDEKNEEIIHNEKEMDKTKDALIHTFKRYQNLCNSKLNKSDVGITGIGISNLKLLPPLKTSSKKFSQTVVSDLNSRECFSSPADINLKGRIKYRQCEELTKDFLCKLTTDDNEKDRFENKTTISSSLMKKEKPSYFGKPLKDGSKYWQIEEFEKDVQCKLKTGDNETDRLEDKINVSRDLMKEKHSYFHEPSKDGSKCWQNEEMVKSFPYKLTTDDYETDRTENKTSFLKSTMKIDKNNLHESSKQKRSESHFHFPWWDNW